MRESTITFFFGKCKTREQVHVSRGITNTVHIYMSS